MFNSVCNLFLYPYNYHSSTYYEFFSSTFPYSLSPSAQLDQKDQYWGKGQTQIKKKFQSPSGGGRTSGT